jgi:hypothetical protein
MRIASAQVTLVVSLDEPQPESPLQHMKKELEAVLYPANIQVAWRDLKTRPASEDYAELVVVKLVGRCVADAEAERQLISINSLGSSATSGGRVLPFIELNCERISQFVQPFLNSQPKMRRELLLGRAMGRVLGHELYHVLGQVQHHSASGIARTCFRARDLLDESFTFDRAALQAIRRQPAQSAASSLPADSGDSGGR